MTSDHDGESPDPRAMPPADPWLDSAPTSPIDFAVPTPTRVIEEEPPRRRRGWWVVAFLAVLACVGGAALYPFQHKPDRSGPSVTPSVGATAVITPTHTTTAGPAKTTVSQAPATPPGQLLIYEVTSNGPRDIGSVQYTDADGEIIRLGGIKLPWRQTFRITGDRKPFVLIAQRKKGAVGAVTCSIRYDGKLLSRTTQTGRFAAPECSG